MNQTIVRRTAVVRPLYEHQSLRDDRAEEMYAPEITGRSAAARVVIE